MNVLECFLNLKVFELNSKTISYWIQVKRGPTIFRMNVIHNFGNKIRVLKGLQGSNPYFVAEIMNGIHSNNCRSPFKLVSSRIFAHLAIKQISKEL
jgi:hypothetical protein